MAGVAATMISALALATVGALLVPSIAAADAYLTAPNSLKEVKDKDKDKDGSDVGIQATSAGGTFACNVPWATVAAKPSGYAIGNCASGVHLRRQLKSDWTDTGYYDGGKIFGSVSGCGWIGVNSSNKVSDLTETLCPGSVGYENSEFMAYSDGCSGVSSCAGTPIANVRTCYLYGNVRPWLSGQTAQDQLRTVPANAIYNGAHRLAWRYTTAYAVGAPWNQQFVMVRDRATSSGQGNWAFTHISCFG